MVFQLKEELRRELQSQGLDDAPHTMAALRGAGGSRGSLEDEDAMLLSSTARSQQQHQRLSAMNEWGELDLKLVPGCCLRKIAQTNGSFFKVKRGRGGRERGAGRRQRGR